MLYRVYAQFVNTNKLLLGAIVNEKTGKDALQDCLKQDRNFAARIQQLYSSVMNSHPLPVQIVNKLSSEGDLSIREPKKSSIRLAFYIDTNFFEQGFDRAIILLLYFPKHDNKATTRAIAKAQDIRDSFLQLKENGELKREVIRNV